MNLTDVITGIDERGVLPRVDAVLSGYQGAEDVGGAILAAVDLVKQRSPRAIYCCDPVMGDVGRGFFVRPGIPEFMRDRVVPQAQIVTPNHFELDFLTGRETHTLDEVIEAAHALRAVGPETVLVTSVVTDTTGDDSLTMLAVTGAGAWQVTTPRLDRVFTGSGDITAAMFLAHWLRTRSAAEAVGATADVVYSVLKQTAESGLPELQLVAAQDEIVSPTYHFDVHQVR